MPLNVNHSVFHIQTQVQKQHSNYESNFTQLQPNLQRNLIFIDETSFSYNQQISRMDVKKQLKQINIIPHLNKLLQAIMIMRQQQNFQLQQIPESNKRNSILQKMLQPAIKTMQEKCKTKKIIKSKKKLVIDQK